MDSGALGNSKLAEKNRIDFCDTRYDIRAVLHHIFHGWHSRNIDVGETDSQMKAILIIGLVLCFVVSNSALLDGTFMPRWLILGITTLILVVLLAIKKSLRIPKNLAMLAFACYLAMAIISLAKAYNIGEGIFEVCKITLLFGYLIVTASIIKDIKQIAKPLAFMALMFGLYGLYYYGFVWGGEVNKFATMSQKNIWCQAMLLLLPFCLYMVFRGIFSWQVIGVIASLAIVINIIILQTRSAMLGLVLSVIAGVYVKSRIYAAGIVSVLLVVLVAGIAFDVHCFTYTETLKDRLCTWRQTCLLTKDKFMVGAGNWQLEIPNYADGMWHRLAFTNVFVTRPHNDFLWVASELSPVGLIFYASIFVLSIFYARHNPYILMGLIGYMVIAFFSFPKERAPLSMLLIIFVALSMSGSRELSLNKTVASCIIAFSLIFIIFNFAIRTKAEYLARKIRDAYAEKEWSKVIRLSDNFFLPSYIDLYGTPTYYYLGVAHELSGDHKSAFAAYAKAGKAHLNHLYNLCGLGICYYVSGQYPKSIACYQKALVIRPDHKGAQQNLESAKRKLRQN